MKGNGRPNVKLTERDRELIATLSQPAPAGAAFGLTQYVHELYQQDDHLRRRFPDLDRDGDAFVEWLHAYGRPQYSIIDELLPPAPRAYRHFNPATPVLGKVLPPYIGVNALSFLRAELATGEAGRLLVAALDERKIPVLPMESSVRPNCRHGRQRAWRRPNELVRPDGGRSAERCSPPASHASRCSWRSPRCRRATSAGTARRRTRCDECPPGDVTPARALAGLH